jgi:dolichol kinase
MFAAVISVSWGIFGDPDAAAVAILMWGVGDAAAALIGIPFGKHKMNIPPVNGKKSWEGSFAMLVISLTAGTGILWLYSGYTFGTSILCAFLMALTGTIAELFSPSEWDTVTVPVIMLASALIIL